MKKLQPAKTVKRIVCPKCGELMVKIYPWSNLAVTNIQIPLCIKCVNESSPKIIKTEKKAK
jgi:hypothetical protein